MTETRDTTAAVADTTPRKIGADAPELTGADRMRHLIERGTAMEAAGWRSIGRALAFRPRVPAGASAFSYDKPFRTVLIMFLVLSAIEIPIVDLITHRWPAVRIPLLVLGIWGVLTMTGILLSYLTRPHAVGPAGIRVRSGGEIDLDLPWEIIASVVPRRRSLPEAPSLCLVGIGDEQVLCHVAQDGTDIDIVLEEPTTFTLPQGAVTVSEVRISVDDRAAFLDAVRTHIP